MVEADSAEKINPMGDATLLTQYKQCNAINEHALREARNIKDLVGINVATVDKKLFIQQNRVRGRGNKLSSNDEMCYNLQMDPVNFLQQVPDFGDREFLVQQSILNQSNKNHVSEAISRQQI